MKRPGGVGFFEDRGAFKSTNDDWSIHSPDIPLLLTYLKESQDTSPRISFPLDDFTRKASGQNHISPSVYLDT